MTADVSDTWLGRAIRDAVAGAARDLAAAPAACTDPQPIPVRLGTGEHVQVMCGSCGYRTPVVADRRSARQHFDTTHGGEA